MNQEPFYSINQYNRKFYGEKVYKISLNGGMSCPNRDGALGTKGCIFCSKGGSGDFAASGLLSIADQIKEAIERISKKYAGNSYIAYFQAFTNTYAPVSYLEKIFTEALMDSRIAGLSIATRPDCLEPDKIELLAKLNRIKPVTIELGLQTTNEDTARYINRGYTLDVFDDTCYRLKEAGIPVVAHMIVGLPGETKDDYLATARHIGGLKLDGIKIQLLHVLRDTDLANDYNEGKFEALSL